jgi:protein-L-isoaspartate O-methyltransferase
MDDAVERRAAMVRNQLPARGIGSPSVLRAMSEVPRERFVDASMEEFAYEDSPLPIGEGHVRRSRAASSSVTVRTGRGRDRLAGCLRRLAARP